MVLFNHFHSMHCLCVCLSFWGSGICDPFDNPPFQNIFISIVMHLSMCSPRGGGVPRADPGDSDRLKKSLSDAPVSKKILLSKNPWVHVRNPLFLVHIVKVPHPGANIGCQNPHPGQERLVRIPCMARAPPPPGAAH